MKISVINKTTGNTGQLAQNEMISLLRQVCPDDIEADLPSPDLTFTLVIEPLESYCWQVREADSNVILSGATESEVLCAVYEVLELLGFLFTAEVTYPKNVDFDVLKGVCRMVKPFAKLRGIRQHLDFPMDLSSYPLAEAKEYILMLARMKYNSIVFFSYDYQFHEGAGIYYFNQGYKIPSDPALRDLFNNYEAFLPPEAETLRFDAAARNDFAVRQLNEMMRFAKKCGMRVSFSIEFMHHRSDDEQISLLRRALAQYQLIDDVEFLSIEGGGKPHEGVTRENFDEYMRESFPSLTKEQLAAISLPENLSEKGFKEIAGSAECIRYASMAYNRQKEYLEGRKLPIRIGLYVERTSAVYCHPLLDMLFPKDVTRIYMPGHGSHTCASNFREMNFAPQETENTAFYSWVEFDGRMFLEQNAIPGIADMIDYLSGLSDQVYGIYMNHWKTAENSLGLAYAAHAAIDKIEPDCFYREIAEHLEIDVDAFIEINHRFGEIDIESNRTIGCIGFCWPDDWVRKAMLTYPGSYTAEKIAPILEKTIKRAEMLSELRRKTKSVNGIKTLRLMENRCRCSISHLNAAGLIARVINKVKAICAEERSLNNAETASLMSVTDEIEWYINEYIDSYADLVPGRGSEGNLVSYVDIYRVCLAHLRTCVIGGIEPCEHWWPHHDSIK